MPMEHNYDVVQSTICPYCGVRLDGATGTDDQTLKVKEGDCSCCIGCGGVLEFDEKLLPCVMRDDVWATLPATLQSQLTRLSASIRAMHGLSDSA